MGYNEDPTLDRRSVLQTIGAGAGLATVPFVGAADRNGEDKFKKTLEQARKIRENAGYRAYVNYLSAKGINTTSTTNRYPFTHGDASAGEGPSTEKIDDVDTKGIDITMSLSWPDYYDPRYSVELFWRYYFKRGTPTESTGEDPKDAIGFSWGDPCWELSSYDYDATSFSSDYVSFEDSAASAGGFGFNVDDLEIARNTTADDCSGYECETYSDYYYGGVYLERTKEENDGCNTNNDTKILGVYDHTWNGSYSSFGISGGFPASISISYQTNSYVDSESTTTEDDGSSGLVVSLDKDSS